MVDHLFAIHDGLASAGRLPALSRLDRRISALEVVLLLACGALSGLVVGFAKLGLGIPGHVIVLAVLPMAFGLSLAPRRMAGTLMSAGALATALPLSWSGATTFGSGAIVSLSLVGPMMDLALRRVRPGWRLYAGFMVAGVAANLLALSSRAMSKLLGIDVPGGRPFDSWWLQALGTYTASGVVAGVVGALCWFQFRDRRRDTTRA